MGSKKFLAGALAFLSIAGDVLVLGKKRYQNYKFVRYSKKWMIKDAQ